MSDESASGFQSSIPSWEQRRFASTGVTKENPGLQQSLAGGTGHRGHQLLDEAAPTPSRLENFPAYENWNYGRVRSSHPETEILADVDRRSVSNIGVFCDIMGTPHTGLRTDRMK